MQNNPDCPRNKPSFSDQILTNKGKISGAASVIGPQKRKEPKEKRTNYSCLIVRKRCYVRSCSGGLAMCCVMHGMCVCVGYVARVCAWHVRIFIFFFPQGPKEPPIGVLGERKRINSKTAYGRYVRMMRVRCVGHDTYGHFRPPASNYGTVNRIEGRFGYVPTKHPYTYGKSPAICTVRTVWFQKVPPMWISPNP